MQRIKFWLYRNIPTLVSTYTCYNDRMDQFKIGEVYVEFTHAWFIKIGKQTLWIKHKPK